MCRSHQSHSGAFFGGFLGPHLSAFFSVSSFNLFLKASFQATDATLPRQMREVHRYLCTSAQAEAHRARISQPDSREHLVILGCGCLRAENAPRLQGPAPKSHPRHPSLCIKVSLFDKGFQPSFTINPASGRPCK